MPKPTRSDIVHKAVIDALRKARLQQGISKYRLAQDSGLSLQAITLIENEQRLPTLHTLLRISDALGVDLNIILRKAKSHVDKTSVSPTARSAVNRVSKNRRRCSHGEVHLDP